MRNSFYLGWRDLASDVHCHEVTAAAGPAWTVGKQRYDFAGARRTDPVNRLLPRTVDWILELPPKARPHRLATEFARIANNLCVNWQDPEACRNCFGNLLTDRRGGRKGFPPEIVKELHRLFRYYAHSHPLRVED